MATTDDFSASVNTLGVLAIGGNVQGNIEISGDKDWFKVTLEKGSSYVFDLSGFTTGGGSLGGLNGRGRLSIYDSAGTMIESVFNGGTGGEARLTYVPTVAGTYYLEASDLSTGVGTYTLQSTAPVTSTPGTGTTPELPLPAGDGSDDYAGTAATSATLTAGQQKAGSIETSGDKDWFKVTLESGVSYVFDLIGQGGGGGTLGATGSRGRLSLVASDGNYLSSVFNGGTGGDAQLSYTATANGTYYLEASDLSGSGTGTYTLKWTSPSGATPPPGDGGNTPPVATLLGTDGKDKLNGGSGDDVIDSKGEIDIAEYALNYANYSITLSAGDSTVQANLGIEGLDTLRNVERLHFADKSIAIDIEGNALQTLQFINVVAPTYVNDLNVRGLILSLLDQKNTLQGLGKLAVELGLLPAAPVDLAKQVFVNLFKSVPPPDLVAELSGYITTNGADKFIADVAVKSVNVDLVGLRTSGMEYLEHQPL